MPHWLMELRPASCWPMPPMAIVASCAPPLPAKDLALSQPAAFASLTWRAWREGSKADLTSRFASFRVRVAARDCKKVMSQPLEWLLVEWPENEAEPTKYWLSSLPENIKLASLVDWAKLRWRIERDYEELKSELGLAHFEGRGWRGFHHHHRRLWLPHPRTSGLSPLRRQNPPNTCHSQPSKTHRRPRYALSDTSRTPSPQTVSTSSSQSLIASLDVPAARDASIFESNDAVELAACSGASAEFGAQIISRRCLRRGGGKVASSSLRSA
jgi:hypothetical protein